MNTTNGDKVAWITGAGKGIGRALAIRLVDQGWIVAVSARTTGDLSSLASECPAGRIIECPLDISDLEKTKTTLAFIEKNHGAVDLAVLNAGTHIPMSADDFSVDAFRNLVEINLMGTVNGLSQLLPRFIERKAGHIAVVASVAGYRGLPTSAAYGATKAALINMCEALKPELEPHGVRLTLISPGFVDTPLTDRNDFPMPFMVSADEAADRIATGLNRSAFEIAFPSRFAFLMKLLRILPDRLFFALTRRMIPK